MPNIRASMFRLLLFLGLFHVIRCDYDEDLECPEGCLCEEENTLFCNNLDITRVPNYWPTHYKKMVLRNSSLTTLHKNSFRKFKDLEELRIEESFQLDVMDKYTFKGLHKLRKLSLIRNPKIAQIFKGTFSGIGNDQSIKIHLKYNGLQQIAPHAFKNANNLRELHIEDECVHFTPNSLSSISVLDFLLIKGACAIDSEAFSNTTRVHHLHISVSSFNLSSKTFDGLTHVNNILIQNNQIKTIQEDAFGGSSTIGNIQIQSNKIDRIDARAFASTENLGTIIVTQNVIQFSLSSPECILNDAQRFVFTDNTIHCSCSMKWIQSHKDTSFLRENFCGREEAFKALVYYQPLGCPTQATLATAPPAPESHVLATFYPASSSNMSSVSSKLCPLVSSIIVTIAQVIFRSIFVP